MLHPVRRALTRCPLCVDWVGRSRLRLGPGARKTACESARHHLPWSTAVLRTCWRTAEVLCAKFLVWRNALVMGGIAW